MEEFRCILDKETNINTRRWKLFLYGVGGDGERFRWFVFFSVVACGCVGSMQYFPCRLDGREVFSSYPSARIMTLFVVLFYEDPSLSCGGTSHRQVDHSTRNDVLCLVETVQMDRRAFSSLNLPVYSAPRSRP